MRARVYETIYASNIYDSEKNAHLLKLYYVRENFIRYMVIKNKNYSRLIEKSCFKNHYNKKKYSKFFIYNISKNSTFIHFILMYLYKSLYRYLSSAL